MAKNPKRELLPSGSLPHNAINCLSTNRPSKRQSSWDLVMNGGESFQQGTSYIRWKGVIFGPKSYKKMRGRWWKEKKILSEFVLPTCSTTFF
jgi:hypothetical protein